MKLSRRDVVIALTAAGSTAALGLASYEYYKRNKQLYFDDVKNTSDQSALPDGWILTEEDQKQIQAIDRLNLRSSNGNDPN